ncbi:arrestin domain-containing protein 3-like [Photinus pyralis]|uniref:arrestin domain-containing protein 3-like n=1 Tax=Photinus pyralis TaxID=7054 RepID=UPI00126750BE|nr:arrestin domain-containing protein 3-like [Photinus pyralis]
MVQNLQGVDIWRADFSINYMDSGGFLIMLIPLQNQTRFPALCEYHSLSPMADRCAIILDTDTYAPGEVVSGRVKCQFHHEINVKGIQVTFRGRVKVKWQERKYTFRMDEREIFNVESNLLEGETTLPPGIYNYPFTFTLPSNIPSSLKEMYGSVKYNVRAVIDRPWALNHERKQAFTVASFNNLNQMEWLRRPSIHTLQKKPLLLFGQSHPITLTVNLPKSGFAPGQTVAFTASLRNESRVHVRGVRFQIVQGFEFHIHTRSRRYNSVDGQEFAIKQSEVAPGEENSWNLELRVPEKVFGATLNDCKLIVVFCTLRGVVRMPFPHKDYVISVPLVLGQE